MTVEHPRPRTLTITAWIFLLLASGLPRIIAQEIFDYEVSFDLSSAFAAIIIIIGLTLTFVWSDVRSLRQFFILFLVLVAAEWFIYTKADQLPIYRSWLSNPSFNVFMLAEQSLRLMVTLAIIVALFILKKTRDAFFLVRGDTSAMAEPVRWMGIKDGERWNKLGRNFAIIISSGTLAFLVLAGRPPLDIVVRALPFYLPF